MNQTQKGKDKFARLNRKLANIEVQVQKDLPKPSWLKIRLSHDPKVQQLKDAFKERNLSTVCEEASCPNLNECFSHGTATFMIMGDKCTRRCTFCDVGHGRPDPLDSEEPITLAQTIANMGLRYVVITSVDRDDLRDGGAEHFTQCIEQIRALNENIQIEILVPDFRGRQEKALNLLSKSLPDVFNHNIETTPSLYKAARPGSSYQASLDLLMNFKKNHKHIRTKSGIMLGLGETLDEVKTVIQDLKYHHVDMLTIGQYLQPSPHHYPVQRYVPPEEFQMLKDFADTLGMTHVASGPLVRSSYHADRQAQGDEVS